jgi:hypothetical protein
MWRLISVATLANLRVRKWSRPIQPLIVPKTCSLHVGAQEAQVGADIDERRRRVLRDAFKHGDAAIEVVEFAHWLVMGSLSARRRGGLGRIGTGVPRPRGPAMT